MIINALRVVVAGVGLLLAAVANGQVKFDHPAGVVRIFGHIVGPIAPVQNKTITLQTTGGGVVATTTTNQEGAFSFSVEPNQHYALNLDIPGFIRWVMGVDVEQNDVDVGNVGVQPPRPIHLSGRLMGYTGALLPNERITLQLEGGQEALTAESGLDGAFTFDGVQPDRQYSWRTDVKGFRPTLMDLDISETNVEMGTVIIQPVEIARANNFYDVLTRSSQRTARIRARVVDANDAPLETVLTIQNVTKSPASSAATINTLKLDSKGNFAFPAEGWANYDLYFNAPGLQPIFAKIANVEVADGQDVDLGSVVVRFPSPNKPMVTLVGPVNVARFFDVAESGRASVPNNAKKSVAAIFISGGLASVILGNGSVVAVPKEKEQVGVSSPLISEDKQAVGWLVDSDSCCTSYPIDQMLAVYRPGTALHLFTGDNRAIFHWCFVHGGMQVAFYQDFLHGTSAQHYELRDIDSGRLVDKWDGELTRKAPKWTRGL